MNMRRTANKYLKKLKDSDTSVFEAFYRLFYVYIRDIAFVYLTDKTYADDVADFTFETVLRNLDEFDETKNGYAWMVDIAKNAAFAKNRDAKVYNVSDGEKLPDFESEGDIVRALRTLDPEHRKIVWLKLYEDKTFAEIGDILGMERRRVHAEYKKAAKILRKYF